MTVKRYPESAERAALGVAIGTDVQAWDTDLDTYAGITPGALGQAILPMTTLTSHGLLLGAGASAPTALAPVATGQVVASQGVSADPAFTATPTVTSVTLNGGTNQTAFAGYREGTFTPTVSDASAHNATLGTAIGRYTRIGRLVTFEIRAAVSSKGSMVGTDLLQIGGLPYASDTTTAFRQAATIIANSLTTAVVWVEAFFLPNATALTVAYRTAAAASSTSMLVSDISTSTDFYVAGSYVTLAAF